MILVIQILLLLLLLFVIYQVCRRDLFAPAVLVCGGYIFSSFCCLLNTEKWGVDEHFYTMFLFIATVFFTFAGDYVGSRAAFGKKHIAVKLVKEERSEIHVLNTKNLLVILFCCVSTYFLYNEIKRVAYLNFADWGNLIYNYKVNSQNENLENSSLSFYVRIMLLTVQALSTIGIYIFANNITIKNSQSKIRRIFCNLVYLIPFVFYTVQTLLRGVRIGVIASLIGFVFFLYYFTRSDQQWTSKRSSSKFLRRGLLSVAILSVLFYQVKEAVGRLQESEGVISYVTTYFGGSVQLLDQYLFSGKTTADGVESIPGLLNILHRFGILKGLESIAGHEYRSAPTGVSIGNAYSAIRNYYHDGGIFGVIFFSFLLGFIFSYVYKKIRQKRVTVFGLLLYADLVYTLIFQCFTDYFFSKIALVWILEVAILYICARFVYVKEFRGGN